MIKFNSFLTLQSKILLNKTDGNLYLFIEEYDEGFYLVTPISGSGYYDREEQWVENSSAFIPITSEADIKMAKLLFEIP